MVLRSPAKAFALGLVALTVAGAPAQPVEAQPQPAALALAAVSVKATDETDPVAHPKDAADDPAIWVNTANPALSLVIGTDKQGGLEVYDLSGTRLQRFANDFGNNVDVRRNFVVSADPKTKQLHVYRVDPAARRLTLVGSVPTMVKAHGLCLYDSPQTGRLYALPNAGSGVVEQYELTVGATSVTGVQRRRFDVGPAIEGCAADDSTGALYISEEKTGTVWRYGAEPGAGTARTLVDSRATSGRFSADSEGIAVVGDWLIVSSQGDSVFNVYDRTSNAFVSSFSVAAGIAADGCSGTDGIEAYAGSLGSRFPSGLFICQDNKNTTPGSKGNQDFKLVDLGLLRAALPR